MIKKSVPVSVTIDPVTKKQVVLNSAEMTRILEWRNKDAIPGISDDSVTSHTEGYNKAIRAFTDAHAYLCDCIMHGPRELRSLFVNELNRYIAEINISLSQTWIVVDAPTKFRCLTQARAYILAWSHIIRFIETRGLFQINQAFLLQTKINMFFNIVTRWAEFTAPRK